MQEKQLYIYLKSKVLCIPSNFPSLTYINQNIYRDLISQHKYKIKSNVRENICQCFLNYLVYGEFPKISLININEYDQLSHEFEFMENIIKLYKKHIINNPKNPLFFKNQELKSTLESTKSHFIQKSAKYKQTIQFLFNRNKIIKKLFYSEDIRSKLYKSCLREDIEKVDLLTRKILMQNGLVFTLNEEEKTSGILGYNSPYYRVIIPTSIIDDQQKYLITIIHKSAFKKSNIVIIEFEEDSQLKLIDEEAFDRSNLLAINIPSHVTKICKKAFACCLRLQSITFSENSELKIIEEEAFGSCNLDSIIIPQSVVEIKDCFCVSDPKTTNIYIDKYQSENYMNLTSFFLGKTDPKNSDSYDLLIEYTGNRSSLKIPSYIKRIGSFSLYGLNNIYDITFSHNSQLNSIGSYSFGFCNEISSISIPPHVTIIESGAFLECEKLETITFSENSELLTIEKKAFDATSIKSLSIPSSIVELKSRWCEGTYELINVKISPKSSNFSYLNNEIIIGRSESSGIVYDTIVFACRNIEKVYIPSFIKKIAGAAFDHCSKLKSVIFSEDSELEIIEKSGFSDCKIKRIRIPRHVKEISGNAFCENRDMELVEFDENSELKLIKKMSFFSNKMEKIFIPSGVKKIEECAFALCDQLKIVHFDNDSKLKFIGKDTFRYSKIDSFSIPASVDEIEKRAFSLCSNLQIIEIAENAQLESIRNEWFDESPYVIIMARPRFIHF